MYGQGTNIAAREEQGADHKGVRGKGQVGTINFQASTIVQGRQSWIGKGRHKQALNEHLGQPPAAAVGK
jgi:hypothetical protein